MAHDIDVGTAQDADQPRPRVREERGLIRVGLRRSAASRSDRRCLMSEMTRCFPRDARAVPQSRTFVRTTLKAWGITASDRVDDVLLCVSELATNALRHGTVANEQFLVKLTENDARLRVEVHDPSRRRPRAQQPGVDDPNGRGLLLVSSLADGWGVEPRSPRGKVVWTEFKVAVKAGVTTSAGEAC
ncbi:ATP-binding protein [Streptomyces sp. NPDC014735]|uniref:ATP-binding protein n=1 Tax=unclassified Streptomyces TaxID=2593676 RepID=UPI0036FA98C0